MKIAIALVLLFAFLIWYALKGRAWLKVQPWAAGFFECIEPIEIALYKKSETILLARAKVFVGVLLSVLSYLGTIDLTPLMPFVPDQYEAYVRAVFNLIPLSISLLGLIDEKLRNQTTQPIEITAAPVNAMPSQVKEAIAMADATKAEAVAAVVIATKKA
jgi:hypothetical protein